MFDSDDAHPTPDGDTPRETTAPTATVDGDDVVARVVAAVDGLAADDPAGLGWAGQRERLRDVGQFTRLCVGWRHALRPDLADAADDRAHDQRRLSHTPTFDGAFHLSGVFDAVAGGDHRRRDQRLHDA